MSISDTGIGVAEELQSRIFEAFTQADGTTGRQYGGTGLGLSISRELVQLLGGEITLASTLGEGSTFTVYLPSSVLDSDVGTGVAASHASPLTAPRKPRHSRPEALAGSKVLVVDDDFRNIFSITVLLERGDLEVLSADSGAEAIAVLESTPDIGLVLVDIMMPVMDGYETIRAMRQLPRAVPLAIIALTAKVGLGERERCTDAGASSYISKPVEDGPDFLADLADCVATATEQRLPTNPVS